MRVFLLKINFRWVTERWLIKVRTVISDYRQAFSNSLWEKMTNWWIEVFKLFYEETDSQGSTDRNWFIPDRTRASKNLKPRTGLKPVTVFKSRTEPNKEIFSNLGPIQTDWSQGLTFRGSLFIEMSEEVILVKSEDDENVPKSPVYLSETTSESSKPEALSVIR